MGQGRQSEKKHHADGYWFTRSNNGDRLPNKVHFPKLRPSELFQSIVDELCYPISVNININIRHICDDVHTNETFIKFIPVNSNGNNVSIRNTSFAEIRRTKTLNTKPNQTKNKRTKKPKPKKNLMFSLFNEKLCDHFVVVYETMLNVQMHHQI